MSNFNDVTATDVHIEAVGGGGRAVEVDFLSFEVRLTVLYELSPRCTARVRLVHKTTMYL